VAGPDTHRAATAQRPALARMQGLASRATKIITALLTSAVLRGKIEISIT